MSGDALSLTGPDAGPSPREETLLVLGGGMCGLTAAVEAAECGLRVHLVDPAPRLGGRVARMASYFPKFCPPACGLELLLARALCQPRLAVHLSRRLAAHALRDARHELTICPVDAPAGDATDAVARLCGDAIIVATGWQPYPLERLAPRGACHPLCLSNVELEERLAADSPGGGELLRPDTGEPPQRMAFVQCAGSRDAGHLPYCSAVCCAATLKHCRLLLERYPALCIDVYYMDVRTPGRLFLLRERLAPYEAAGRLRFLPARPPRAVPHADGLSLPTERTDSGEHLALVYDLVVWATGMQPSLAPQADDDHLPGLSLRRDAQGFVTDSPEHGIFAAGCARRPMNVSESARSGAAAVMRALAFLQTRRTSAVPLPAGEARGDRHA